MRRSFPSWNGSWATSTGSSPMRTPHANIGPEATRAGWLILKLEEKLQLDTPNLSLKYDADITPDDFVEAAILCSPEMRQPRDLQPQGS